MARNRSARPTDADGLERTEPDVGFQFGVGVYAAAILTAVATTAAAAADASTGVLVGLYPTGVTVGTIVGGVVAGRVRGIAERLGGRRWHWTYPLVPAVPFVLVAGASPVLPAIDGRTTIVALVSAIGIGFAGLVVSAMARNRYVDAVTPDEPTATWTWHRVGPFRWEFAAGAVFLGLGIVHAVRSDWFYALLWGGYGAFWTVSGLSEGRWLDPDATTRPTLSVHEAGLVKSRRRTKTIVPWETVRDVRLTDDELVVERRWLDVRCDRAPIDDPESVVEAIERTRDRALDP